MFVEVRGKLVRIGSLLPMLGSQGSNQVIRLGGKHLCLLRHVISKALIT